MSRWDALKPDLKQRGIQTTTKQQYSKRWNGIPKGTSDPNRQSGKIASISKAESNVHEVGSQVLVNDLERLQKVCQSDPKNVKNAIKLANLLCSTSQHVSGRIVATAVQDILQFLSLTTVETLSENAGILAIFDAIITILNNEIYFPVLMAASIDDVSEVGNEQQTANPIRIRLFDVLRHLLTESMSKSSKSADKGATKLNALNEKICLCIIKCLEVAKQVDSTQHHATQQDLDFNPQTVLQSLRRSLEPKPDPLRINLSLKMMYALLRRHPECSSTFATNLLLIDSSQTSAKGAKKCCRCCCMIVEQTSFLGMFHSVMHQDTYKFNTDDMILKCTTEILASAPLQLWLRHGKNSQKFHSSSSFRSRMLEAMENIIRITRCRLNDLFASDNTESICNLVETIFTRISYLDKILDTAASELVQVVASLVVSEASNDAKHKKVLVETLIECLGGRAKPQGQRTRMCPPLAAWLHRPDGAGMQLNALSFTAKLIGRIKSDETDYSIRVFDIRLLQALLKNHPFCVLASEQIYVIFQDMVRGMIKSREHRDQLHAVTIIDSFLQGRMEQEEPSRQIDVPSANVLPFVITLLLKSLGVSKSCQSACCVAFGSLTNQDWAWLSSNNDGLSIQSIIIPILSICEDTTVGTKDRSEVYRGVGNICSNLFTEQVFETLGCLNELERLDIGCTIFTTLRRAMLDEASSVRSMALFAAGNLAKALYESPVTFTLELDSCIETASRCFDLINYYDEKVAGNAIRSVGHFATLLIRKECKSSLGGSYGLKVANFLEALVFCLVSKVNSAISMSIGNGSVNTFSWKQRSGIKKHGWGACNTLALLFENGLAQCNWDSPIDGLQLCGKSLSCLLECIIHISMMNEKVIVSAILAVRSLNIETIRRIVVTEHETNIGEAITECFVSILNVDTDRTAISPKICVEVEHCLEHLLQCAKHDDAQFVIQSTRLSTKNCLLQIYHWLIAKELPDRIFEYFAQVMQLPIVNVDIQIEQMFSNHAKRSLLRESTENDDQNEL